MQRVGPNVSFWLLHFPLSPQKMGEKSMKRCTKEPSNRCSLYRVNSVNPMYMLESPGHFTSHGSASNGKMLGAVGFLRKPTSDELMMSGSSKLAIPRLSNYCF